MFDKNQGKVYLSSQFEAESHCTQSQQADRKMSIAGARPDFAFLFSPGLQFISGATILRVGLDVSVKPI